MLGIGPLSGSKHVRIETEITEGRVDERLNELPRKQIGKISIEEWTRRYRLTQ